MEHIEQLQQRVLEHVRSENYQPVKPRVIAKQLGLGQEKEALRLIKKVVKRLVRKGQLAYLADHHVTVGKPTSDSEITGTFRRTKSGNGYVRPVGSADRESDIYVPARRAMDASNGDVVRLQLRGHRPKDGRPRGEVLEIVERQSHRFVGVYRERSGVGQVQVDGNVFAQDVLVGDAGAKSVHEDDKVVIEMVRFPSERHPGEGVIVDVLGARGQPGVDTLSIIHEFNLPGPFPESALDVARQQAEHFDETIGQERNDATGETVLTIDPVDARDFDDAISLKRLENGHWQLRVHIADVAHFVPKNSALDQEARSRATSVYLPDRVIPMLPEVISNNLASLQPGRIRYARTVTIEFTADGAAVATDVERTAIRSDRRFTYEEVDEFLADREAWRDKLEPDVFRLLAEMYELAMMLRRRRMDRGAIELILPEVKVDLDRRGVVTGAHLVDNTESHQIIEEFMLAANEAVATWLHDRELYFLRRIHGQPNPRKLKALTEFVRELGFKCDSLESRFEIKRVVEAARGLPEQHAVHFAVLRSMQKAVYGPEVEGHFALHSDHYCHFTSPIRRYPDLTVHRIFDALADDKTPPEHFNELVALGAHCSDREQRAEIAERELIKVKLLDFLSHRIGQKMNAVITGVEDYGMFAQLVELPADGLIHVNSLQDDYYHYDAASRSLTGNRGKRYRLGDLVEVEIVHADIDRRQLDLRVVATKSKSKAHNAPSRGAAAGKSQHKKSKRRASPEQQPRGRPKGKKKRRR